MVRPEYKIKRQGKDYILYPGLLNEAHEKFQTFRLKTKLLEGGDKPLVRASFHGWIEGLDYPIQTSGYGTAGRKSDTGGAAAEAPIEMAETRAKARALRDAVNIGETAFEELPSGADIPDTGPLELQRSGARKAERAHPPKRSDNSDPEKVSRPTLNAMKVMLSEDAKYKGVLLDERIEAIENYLGYPIDAMGEEEAKGWIAQFEQILSHRAEIASSASSA